MSQDAARADLVRRWLARFGPGTLADIVWWTGWNQGDTRRALAAIEETRLFVQELFRENLPARTINAKAPENHPNEAARGKDVQIDVTVKDIKRLELAEITPELLQLARVK